MCSRGRLQTADLADHIDTVRDMERRAMDETALKINGAVFCYMEIPPDFPYNKSRRRILQDRILSYRIG